MDEGEALLGADLLRKGMLRSGREHRRDDEKFPSPHSITSASNVGDR